jgi:methyltransferase (TIGR00027 family)
MKANKPSATATLIARSQMMLAETQGWAVDAGYLAQYRSFAGENNPAQRAFLKLTEIFAIPGLYLHFALRKKLIESIVQGQIEKQAVQQIVVIAAGFDPLAAVLHEAYPLIRFFEIDHPATQVIKMEALADAGSNLFFCPADLTKTSITDALAPDWFDANLPTIFIAEGITMYLDAKQLDTFFAGIRARAQHPDSSVIFTYMARSPLGVIGFDSQTWLARLWLQLQGEPMKWGIEPENLPGFLAARGFTLNRDHSAADLSARFMGGRKQLRLAKGENICWASVAKS